MRRLSSVALLAIILGGVAIAQQAKGDKEIGLGGSLQFPNNATTATLSAQVTLGYFFTRTNYIGVEAIPTITWSGSPTVTTTSGYFGGNYRHLFGPDKGKAYFFVGVGGGGFALGGGTTQTSTSGGSTSNTTLMASLDGEAGIKYFLSQKTSLELSYNLILQQHQPLPTGPGLPPDPGWQFQNDSQSLILLSIRHIF